MKNGICLFYLSQRGQGDCRRKSFLKESTNKENNVVGGVQQQEDHLVDGRAGQRWQDLHFQDHRGGGGDKRSKFRNISNKAEINLFVASDCTRALKI